MMWLGIVDLGFEQRGETMFDNNKRMYWDGSEPDGFMSDGTPVYIQCARGDGKSMLQLELYCKLVGISDEEWAKLQEQTTRRLGYLDE